MSIVLSLTSIIVPQEWNLNVFLLITSIIIGFAAVSPSPLTWHASFSVNKPVRQRRSGARILTPGWYPDDSSHLPHYSHSSPWPLVTSCLGAQCVNTLALRQTAPARLPKGDLSPRSLSERGAARASSAEPFPLQHTWRPEKVWQLHSRVVSPHRFHLVPGCNHTASCSTAPRCWLEPIWRLAGKTIGGDKIFTHSR